MRTGSARLPLHGGKAPRWLFERMVALSREMTLAVVAEYGPDEMLRRLADPVWFQAFGCVLGFDWHSSGVTTTVTGALKEGLRGLTHETGLVVAGGKGATSRKTPAEIEEAAERGNLAADPARLVYASRMSAKVDSAALQDGYQLYHHAFVFTTSGAWAVVQQGMSEADRTARRYHWLSEDIRTGERGADLVSEPHEGIASESRCESVLDLTAEESRQARDVVAGIAGERPEAVVRDYSRLLEMPDRRLRQEEPNGRETLEMPRRHHVLTSDIRPENLRKALQATYELRPSGFEELLGTPGVGAKTVRALTLMSEVVHGTAASRKDPALFSFAHGGKDGYPYPVDLDTYDRDIGLLREALRQAKLGRAEKLQAFKRLSAWEGETAAG